MVNGREKEKMSKNPSSITTTYHRSYNYGASLQAYALQQALIGIGFENKILDFSRNSFVNEPFISGNLKIDIARMLFRILSFFHIKEKKRLIKKFDEFTKKYLQLTRKYDSFEDLCENIPEVDCFITGSDQVFTVRKPELVVSRNMLAFVKGRAKKYSYAASLAEYDLNNSEKEKFKKLLNDFDAVSVREKRAANYLLSNLGIECRVDLDPVFLLNKDDWVKIAKVPEINVPYILYYQVNSNPLANYILKKIKNLTKKMIVCVQTNPIIRVKADRVILDASPEEFLGWIMNADLVVTTSFHGTAFSILFEKDFYTLTKPSSNPVRIINLLENYHLDDRLIYDVEGIDLTSKINWNNIIKLIEKDRNYSLQYLKDIYSSLK